MDSGSFFNGSDGLVGVGRFLPAWVVIVAVALAAPTDARAEQASADDEAADGAIREQARQHFLRGMNLVQAERWEDALEAFEASLELYPTRAAQFNKGLCLGLMGRPADAIRVLEEHLEQYADQLDGDRRAEVDRALETNRARVARLEVRVEGVEAAEVLLDGQSVGQSPLAEALVVNPGRHQVSVRAEGIDTVNRWVTVSSGDAVSVVMAVERAEVSEPVDDPEDQPVTIVPVEPAPSAGLRIGGWVSVGVAVAALGTALGLFLWNNGRYSDWETDREALSSAYSSTEASPQEPGELGRWLEDSDSEAESISSVDTVTWIMLGTGVAATAAGVTLLILDARRRAAPVVAAPTLGGFVLSGQW